MKEHISALMDGELFDDEAEALFDKLKRDPAGHEQWLQYHLISDILRQPEHVHADISSTLRERLKTEPTVLAPHGRGGQKVRWFALSAAASVMALAIVGWLSVQVGPEAAAPQIAMQQPDNSSVRPASMNVDDYLMAHQEYSPSASMEGMTPYIRTVASEQGGK